MILFASPVSGTAMRSLGYPERVKSALIVVGESNPTPPARAPSLEFDFWSRLLTVRRRPAKPTNGELALEEVFLTRDWARLRVPQTLVGFGIVPIGAVGQVVKVGPTGALVRFRGKYPPTDVNLTYLDTASFVDLLPIAAQPVARLFGGWLVRAFGIAITAAITLLVAKALGKL